MAKRLFTCLIVCFIAILSTSCSSQSTVDKFDPQLFAIGDYKMILCFDLRDDRDPLAGLVIKRDPGSETTMHSVELPFPSSAVQVSPTLKSTFGQYQDRTLITYTISPQNAEINGIGIKPLFGFPRQPDLLGNSGESLYFFRSPDDRRFIYIYSEHSKDKTESQIDSQAKEATKLDAIAIAFPEDSEGVELSNGQTSIPPFLTQKDGGRIRYYPASTVKETDRLQVRYRLLDSYSIVFIESAIKLVGVLLVPLVTLILLKKGTVKHPRSRKILITVFVSLEFCLFAGILFYLLKVKVPNESEAKAILDAVLTVITLAVGIVATWVASQPAVPPGGAGS